MTENDDECDKANSRAEASGSSDASTSDAPDSQPPDSTDPNPFPFKPIFDVSQFPDFTGAMRAFDMDKVRTYVERLPDLSRFAREIEFAQSAALPMAKFQDQLRSLDFAIAVPKINIVPLNLQLPRLDLGRFSQFGENFAGILRMLKDSLPPNWPDDIDLSKVPSLVNDEGLPIVWVPRSEILAELLEAPDRDTRIAILLSHEEDIITDCQAILRDVSHDSLSGQFPLAVEAVSTLASGHYEAAQALAVVVTETAVARILGGNYRKVKKAVLFDLTDLPFIELRLKAALAPIGSFYTEWYASSGSKAPAELSRHVTVHQADQEHYTRANAIIAAMLVTSVLRALHELQELADTADDPLDGQ